MSAHALPPHLLVADGERALFLRRHGEGAEAHLEVEDRMVEEHAATRDQGTDRPGSRGESVGAMGAASARGAIEPTDFHQQDETRFARKVVDRLQQVVREKKIDRLTVIAPPKMLADLRRFMPKDVAERIESEIPKDLATATLGTSRRWRRGCRRRRRDVGPLSRVRERGRGEGSFASARALTRRCAPPSPARGRGDSPDRVIPPASQPRIVRPLQFGGTR